MELYCIYSFGSSFFHSILCFCEFFAHVLCIFASNYICSFFTVVYYFLYDCHTMYLYIVDGLLIFSPFWSSISTATMNILIYVITSFRHLGVELLGHRTDVCSTLQALSDKFSSFVGSNPFKQHFRQRLFQKRAIH